MKIIGRILIILVVFAVLSGLMVATVNASGSNTSSFDGAPQLHADGDMGGRPEHGERGAAGGSRWMFGLLKNVGVMAVLVTIIAWPKSVAKKKRKQAAINSANSQS